MQDKLISFFRGFPKWKSACPTPSGKRHALAKKRFICKSSFVFFALFSVAVLRYTERTAAISSAHEKRQISKCGLLFPKEVKESHRSNQKRLNDDQNLLWQKAREEYAEAKRKRGYPQHTAKRSCFHKNSPIPTFLLQYIQDLRKMPPSVRNPLRGLSHRLFAYSTVR